MVKTIELIYRYLFKNIFSTIGYITNKLSIIIIVILCKETFAIKFSFGHEILCLDVALLANKENALFFFSHFHFENLKRV